MRALGLHLALLLSSVAACSARAGGSFNPATTDVSTPVDVAAPTDAIDESDAAPERDAPTVVTDVAGPGADAVVALAVLRGGGRLPRVAEHAAVLPRGGRRVRGRDAVLRRDGVRVRAVRGRGRRRRLRGRR